MRGAVAAFAGRHPILWRAAALAVAAGLGLCALFAFALGTCHDAGGICEGEFTADNAGSYAVAAVFVAGAAALTVVTVTRRRAFLVASALVAGAFVALSAVGLELLLRA